MAGRRRGRPQTGDPMKLVTFYADYGTRIGALLDGAKHVLDLHMACELYYAERGHGKPRAMADALCPPSMVDFLQVGDEALELARSLLADFPTYLSTPRVLRLLQERRVVLPLKGLRLAAPVPRPGKILCLGMNYRDHAAEAGQPVPEVPVIFTKPPSCVIGPGDPILLPKVSSEVDYEIEFAFVMGRRAKDVPDGKAMDYVAGYTIFHDVSARDYQLCTSQWYIGKAFDTFGPMGPFLITKDEVPDPHALAVELRLNGEVRQKSSTRNLIFGVPRLVAFLSEVMTLEPGDVVATGTPAGVGFGRKPPRWLKPGEEVIVRIAGIGELRNPTVAE
jgi:acylpyruvate hydrolase